MRKQPDDWSEVTISGRRYILLDTGRLLPIPCGSSEGDEKEDDAPQEGAGGDGEDAEEDVSGEKPKPPPPNPDARDEELRVLRDALATKDQQMTRMFDAVAANTAAGNRAAPTDDTPKISVSEDAIEAAYEAGDEKLARRLERKLQREELAVSEHRSALRTRAEVAPVANQITGYGLPALASIVRTQVEQEPAVKRLPARFKPKVDEYIAQLNPEGKTNPEIVRRAYALVIGEHFEEILEEETERRVRERLAAPAGGGTGRPGRSTGKDLIPTVEDLFGKEVARDVNEAGGPDKWARKSFGMDWATYAKLAEGNA